MALTIVNEQYPPRKPKLTLTADSLDELPTEGVAEGSTATVGGTEYSYDSNAGWIEPGSGGGSSGGVLYVTVTDTTTDEFSFTIDKTYEEMVSMIQANGIVIFTMGDIFGIANIVGEDISCTLTRFQGETMYVYSIYVSSDSANGFEDIYALTPST